jgi:sphinganine C4-monooxygenase
MLGEEETIGSEEYALDVWTSRVHFLFAAIPSILSVTGIDVKAVVEKLPLGSTSLSVTGRRALDMPSIEVLAGSLLYWYVVPVLQVVVALIVADASMYFLHRLGHTNKWIYSKTHEQRY